MHNSDKYKKEVSTLKVICINECFITNKENCERIISPMVSSKCFSTVNRLKGLPIMVVVLVTLFLLNGCASKEEEPVIEYKDKEFVEDLALGWQERFDCESQAAEEDDAEKQQELLLKGCEAELTRVEKYSSEEFKRQGLKDLTGEYIACLKETKNALQFYISDNDKYISMTQSANNDRRRILTRLVSDYGMTVDDKYKDVFSESLTNAIVSGAYSKQQKSVEDLVKGIKFEKEPDEYYDEKYHTYSGNVKNTTGISFERIDIKVKLYDSDNVVVGTENVYLENFKPDSTERVEFSTDAEFEKMEVSCDSWKEAQ